MKPDPVPSPINAESFESIRQNPAVLETIARGEQAVEEGRTVTHEVAKQYMDRWLKRHGG